MKKPVANFLSIRKNRYALTSKRIILDTGRVRKTMELTNLPCMHVKHQKEGSGSIFFGETIYRRSNGVRFRAESTELVMWGLADVNQLEYRIQNAVDQALAAQNATYEKTRPVPLTVPGASCTERKLDYWRSI